MLSSSVCACMCECLCAEIRLDGDCFSRYQRWSHALLKVLY